MALPGTLQPAEDLEADNLGLPERETYDSTLTKDKAEPVQIKVESTTIQAEPATIKAEFGAIKEEPVDLSLDTHSDLPEGHTTQEVCNPPEDYSWLWNNPALLPITTAQSTSGPLAYDRQQQRRSFSEPPGECTSIDSAPVLPVPPSVNIPNAHIVFHRDGQLLGIGPERSTKKKAQRQAPYPGVASTRSAQSWSNRARQPTRARLRSPVMYAGSHQPPTQSPYLEPRSYSSQPHSMHAPQFLSRPVVDPALLRSETTSSVMIEEPLLHTIVQIRVGDLREIIVTAVRQALRE